MNPLLKLILFIIALLFCIPSLYAQSDQLDRDIRIAERILQEIFTPVQASGERQILLPASRGVEGEYIPGIGVHFKFAGLNTQFVYVDRSKNEQLSLSGNIVTREWIEEKTLEYLKNYAPQLRGLSDSEQVRVTYGSASNNPFIIFTGSQRESTETRQPKLTAWVTMADLKQYSSGNLSDSQFKNRVSVTILSEQQEMRDLNIFASVLEAAMNSTDSKHLKVNRKPTYEYLPGLGAHFHVNVNSGVGLFPANIRGMARQIDSLDLDNVDIQIDLGNIPHEFNFQSPQIEFRNDSLRVAIRGMSDSLRVHANELRGQVEVIREHAEAARRQGQEIQRQFAISFAERDTVDLTEDTARLMTELKTAIKDYGSTLSSLGDNEMLMITVNWSGRNPTVPDRTHIRISKSDLIRGAEPNIEEIRRR